MNAINRMKDFEGSMEALRKGFRRKMRLARRQPDSIRPCEPRPVRRDCHGRIVHALVPLCGDGAEFLDATLTPWCSATFAGARHCVRVTVPQDADADAIAARVAAYDFDVRGHVVVDCAVEADGTTHDGARVLTLAALTVEDW